MFLQRGKLGAGHDLPPGSAEAVTDRQQLEDVLEGGLTQVAHIFLSPTEPEYKDVEGRGVRYEYDARRANQMIEQLGYAKDAEGQYRDGTGQQLTLEMRTYGAKVSDQASVSVADAWIRRPLLAMHQILQQAGLIS